MKGNKPDTRVHIVYSICIKLKNGQNQSRVSEVRILINLESGVETGRNNTGIGFWNTGNVVFLDLVTWCAYIFNLLSNILITCGLYLCVQSSSVRNLFVKTICIFSIPEFDTNLYSFFQFFEWFKLPFTGYVPYNINCLLGSVLNILHLLSY